MKHNIHDMHRAAKLHNGWRVWCTCGWEGYVRELTPRWLAKALRPER